MKRSDGKKIIIYKDTFVDRLERQLRYIARNSPSSARKLRIELIKRIKSIPSNPYQFRKSIYFESEEIRDLIHKGYTVVFRINGDSFEVFGFVKFQEKPTDLKY